MRTVPLALLAFALAAPAADAPPAAKPPADWQDDPVCRMVFHAVLEGLYEDGVPDAVVDAVVPRAPKEGADPVKRSFVVQCPLCHPVYEAFAAYQKRPAFAGDKANRTTFGKGLDEDAMKKLTADDNATRLKALAPLVQKWVERRLTAMRLTDAELTDWRAQLSQRSGQGKNELRKLLQTDPNYKGWSMYWGCAACNGVTSAGGAVRAVDKKN